MPSAPQVFPISICTVLHEVFKCTHCSETFERPSALISHQRGHIKLSATLAKKMKLKREQSNTIQKMFQLQQLKEKNRKRIEKQNQRKQTDFRTKEKATD